MRTVTTPITVFLRVFFFLDTSNSAFLFVVIENMWGVRSTSPAVAFCSSKQIMFVRFFCPQQCLKFFFVIRSIAVPCFLWLLFRDPTDVSPYVLCGGDQPPQERGFMPVETVRVNGDFRRVCVDCKNRRFLQPVEADYPAGGWCYSLGHSGSHHVLKMFLDIDLLLFTTRGTCPRRP